MSEVGLFCFNPTTFTKSGEIDEEAQRQFLQRFIDAKIGLYMGSGGGGEGHALTRDDLRRLYKVGVEACKGKIPVHANPPEQHTARVTIEHAKLAIECGIEVIHVYTLAGWHAMKPTDSELLGYYDAILSEIKHPITVSVNPSMGYVPKPALMAKVCNKYPQVVAAKMTGTPDTYLLDLKDMVTRNIELYVSPGGSANALTSGASGLFSTEANLIPKTLRQYLNLLQQGKLTEMGIVYGHMRRFDQYVRQWNPSIPRWIKMGMKMFKLPGGEGGLRKPYLMPSDEELKKFMDGLLKLGIPEIQDQAKAAGII